MMSNLQKEAKLVPNFDQMDIMLKRRLKSLLIVVVLVVVTFVTVKAKKNFFLKKCDHFVVSLIIGGQIC
jgi:uncharacterized membrane protein